MPNFMSLTHTAEILQGDPDYPYIMEVEFSKTSTDHYKYSSGSGATETRYTAKVKLMYKYPWYWDYFTYHELGTGEPYLIYNIYHYKPSGSYPAKAFKIDYTWHMVQVVANTDYNETIDIGGRMYGYSNSDFIGGTYNNGVLTPNDGVEFIESSITGNQLEGSVSLGFDGDQTSRDPYQSGGNASYYAIAAFSGTWNPSS